VPEARPFTAPVEPTVAVAGTLLLHVPPVVVSLSDVLPFTQIRGVPVIGAGISITLINAVAATVPQLLVTVYDMVAVPGAIPCTTPDDTVPTAALVLLHEPAPVASVRAVLLPRQTEDEPLMLPASGDGFTVTVKVVEYP